MNRTRTPLVLAGITLAAMFGLAGTTGALAEDFQSQGSHLNDPANTRSANDQQQDPKASRLNDPANTRSERPADTANDKPNKPDTK